MDESAVPSRDAALRLHRAGQIDAAVAAYAGLLAAAPEDADLLGLIGVAELQRSRTAAAEALLERALAAGGPAELQLRNLNNLLALLLQAGRRSEALALVAGDFPEWPDGAVPDDAARGTLLSLAEALLLLGKPARARALLSRAIPDPGDDTAALGLTGRLQAVLGEDKAALGTLARALAQEPGDARLLIALAPVHERLGQEDAARAAAASFARRFGFHAEPPRPGQEATILVANVAPRRIVEPDAVPRALHFAQNYPGQIRGRMADRYRFLSVFGDVEHPDRPWEREGAQILISNMVNSEWLHVGNRFEAARAFVGGTGLPVINPPEQVLQCTRQKNAALLAGIPDLVVPQIAHYRPGIAAIDEIVADIGGRFAWPVILRGTTSHESSNTLLPGARKAAYLAHGPDEVQAAIAQSGWPEFYVIQFVDLRKPEGWYRKIRAVFVGDQIEVTSGGYFDQWMAVGWRTRQPGIDFYRANPAALERFRRLLDDPEAALGRGALAALRGIRERIPLDIFGVDFDVDDEGRAVFFEATAAMIIYPPGGAPDDLWMPEAPLRRITAALHEMVAHRIAADGGTANQCRKG